MPAPAPAPSSADQKPVGRPETQLRLHFESGGEVTTIKLLSTTPFHRAIAAYCSRKGISVETMKFSFNGIRIQGYDTPDSLDMEDGDGVIALPCFPERSWTPP
jgi:hypothetical protein